MQTLSVRFYAIYQRSLESESAPNDLLGYADKLVRENCLKDADRVYRAVIRDYTAPMFQAARQRAQIGIDDLRAKK